MNEIIEKDNIETMIYEIRGKQVIMDFDLAKLYNCTNGTKDINKAVKRNINRFPEDFYFQLNDKDLKDLWFQIGTKKINIETRGGKLNKPHAFTELGISMLSSVLHTNTAVEVSINIIRTFVKMKNIINISLINQKHINDIVLDDHKRLLKLENTFDKLQEKQKVNTIFFNGQIHDAYSLLLDILSKAKEEIIIIDNYAGKELLDILKILIKK